MWITIHVVLGQSDFEFATTHVLKYKGVLVFASTSLKAERLR